MNTYANRYQRTMVQSEVMILKSMVLYRQKKEEWKEILADVIKLADNMMFYRFLSEEGAPLLKMLQEPSFAERIQQGNTYWDKLLKETKQMALHYPTYLYKGGANPPELSKRALQILQMQSEGFSYGDIAKLLGIKETTVKYHCGENYKKLGVTGKADAIMVARDLKLL